MLWNLIDEVHEDEAGDQGQPHEGMRLSVFSQRFRVCCSRFLTGRIGRAFVFSSAVERLDAFGDDDDEAGADQETGSKGRYDSRMILRQAERKGEKAGEEGAASRMISI